MQLVLTIFAVNLLIGTAVREELQLKLTKTEVQTNMSADAGIMQAGSLLDGRYMLTSKLATNGWPKNLPGFEPFSKLGEGAFGETWLAQDQQLSKQVAVKFFYRDTARGRILLNMGIADAEEQQDLRTAAAECKIPDLIIAGGTSGQNRFARCLKDNSQVYEGVSYLVLEVAGNQNLESYLASRTPPTVANLLRISLMLAEGLAQLQESGYVHRDIKPANIMLVVSGRDVIDLKYIDFGLAKKNIQQVWPSGTPLYMPPELWPVRLTQAQAPAHSHDVYSVGETIFEMICGKTFHEHVLDKFSDLENWDKKVKLETEKKNPYCSPPRTDAYFESDAMQTLYVLAAGNMMANSGRPTGNQILKNGLWAQVTPVQTKQAKVNPMAAPQESGLQKCHSDKSFWFNHLVKCCAEEKPDVLREAICEKPCGGNVGFKHGLNCLDERTGVECGNTNRHFNRQKYCCVDKNYPDLCQYVGLWDAQRKRRKPDLPTGHGWGWMSGR